MMFQDQLVALNEIVKSEQDQEDKVCPAYHHIVYTSYINIGVRYERVAEHGFTWKTRRHHHDHVASQISSTYPCFCLVPFFIKP